MTLEILVSERLGPIRHGFFTRLGGASSGIFDGLNCGHGSSDQRDMVAINRARAAAALAVEVGRLVTVRQTHSSTVLTLDAPPEGPLPEADALVTATPGLAIAVLTADCQPILMADAEAGVVAAVHAGWRGTQAGIIERSVAAMEALGARAGRIAATIGPAISQPSYEVGPEFLEAMGDADPDSLRHFVEGEGDRYLFDLPGYGLRRLRRAGVGTADWLGHCTYGDPARFFSYRRSVHRREPDYGRLISAIRL